MSNTAAQRIQDIAAEIANATRAAIGAREAMNEQKEAFQEAASEAGARREELMGTVAALSHAGAWEPNEVTSACVLIGSAHMNTETSKKSFETMQGEIKKAAHPRVREHFATLLTHRNRIWSEEAAMLQADKENADTPAKRTFSRAYHMLVRMMGALIGETKKDGTWKVEPVDVTDEGALRDWIASIDPRYDPTVVVRKMKSLLDDLTACARDFPIPMVTDLADFIKAHTPEEITAQVKAAQVAAAEKSAAERASKEIAAATLDEALGDDSTDNTGSPNEPVQEQDSVDALIGLAA